MYDTAETTGDDSVSTAARMLRGVLSILAVLMCALALGAVVALIALFAGVRPCWPMLPGAPLLVSVLRGTGSLRGKFAPAAAVIAVLLAALYAECLAAIARIAAITGATFAEALRLGGSALTLQVAELGLSPFSILIYAAAAVLAAWLTRSR